MPSVTSTNKTARITFVSPTATISFTQPAASLVIDETTWWYALTDSSGATLLDQDGDTLAVTG